MNRQETMDFLKKCADLQNEYLNLKARENGIINYIKEIDSGPKDIGYTNTKQSIVASVILSSLLLGLMGLPFAALIIAIFAQPANFLYKTFHWSFADVHPVWTHILFSFVLVTILAIPLAIPMCKEKKKNDVGRYKSYQDALAKRPELEKELMEIFQKKQSILAQLNQLSTKGILYDGYIPYANELWWYFKKGRVDTLKEAINLLEHDLSEEERRAAERQYREEMQQQAREQQEMLRYIANETGRAADAAQSAAAWSAAGTILTAAEIERRRRKERRS